MKKELRKKLRYLKENFSIIDLKGGTEVEDMTFKEIAFLHDVTKNIVPLNVKIGGPEARNDIRYLIKIGVEGIIAPMIESEYGLINFINTISEYDLYRPIYKGINIETRTAFSNIQEIISLDAFSRIAQVTVGRSDLAASFGKDSDDSDIYDIAGEIVRSVRAKGKITSIGGNISPNNIERIKSHINPHRVNTRHVSIDLQSCNNCSEAAREALLFEAELCKGFIEVSPSKRKSYLQRIDTLYSRLESSKIYSLSR